MTKVRMRDVVLLLPGITGSVLQKNGKDLWAISGQAAWKAFTSLGSSLQQLRLESDDPNVDDLGDGIRATHLMPRGHLVPGLGKNGGYSLISSMITDQFEVIRGKVGDEQPANFFEFPYDWRRDIRAIARRLKMIVDLKLPQWREFSGASDAKLIFLAHSMGGLVARYYVEALEGWRDCRALITFGTPHRGSVNALNYLANGYKKLFVDLTNVMRSFTSMYQLLPIYKVIRVGSEYRCVSDVDSIPGVERKRAREARAFHDEIAKVSEKHKADPEYQRQYKTIPVVGTRQRTLQSAELSEGRLVSSQELPEGIDALLGDGDGTVPRLSAIPIELSNEYRETFVPERHSSLHNNLHVLDDVLERLKQMQIPGLSTIRGAETKPEVAGHAAISVDLEDLYLAREPVTLHARLINMRTHPGGLRARIESVGTEPVIIEEVDFKESDNEWVLTLETLPAGLYQMEVRTLMAGPRVPGAVHDIFEVAGG